MAARRALLLLSGGVESSVLLHQLIRLGRKPVPLFANYAQRGADAEFRACVAVCEQAGLHKAPQIVDLTVEGAAFQRISGLHVPLPHRNLVLMSLALSWATVHRCEEIALGLNRDDFAKDSEFARRGQVRYTTGTERFVERFRLLVEEVAPSISIVVPQAEMSKVDVIALGRSYGVDLAATYSCMRTGPGHCGACMQCRARRTAFESAGVEEPEGFYRSNPT